MKRAILILMAIVTFSVTAQEEDNHQWFFQVGLDPAIGLNLPTLSGDDRVGGGHLNYLIQAGREYFEEDKIGYKFGVQWEQFAEINYTSYGAFGGVTFNAPTIPFTNVTLGHYWYATAQLFMIDRKGIEGSQIYNADKHTAWGIGATIGIRINEPDLGLFKLPFDVEFLIDGKDRPDKRVHFDGGKFDSINDITFSGYVMFVFNF